MTYARSVAVALAVLPLLPSLSFREQALGQQGIAVSAPQRGESHQRAPQLPEIIPPQSAQEIQTLKLPAVAHGTVVGGGGRFIILHLKSLRQLAVFDANAAKIVKYLPIASDDISFAAGAEKLVVVLRDQNIIQRWNLLTFKKEITKTIATNEPVATTVMGSASNGPIFVGCGSSYRSSRLLLDLETLEPSAIAIEGGLSGNAWRCSGGSDCVVHVSADGRVFTMWRLGTSPSGLQSLVISGNSGQVRYEHESVGDILPSADGSRLYTSRGVFTNELKRLGNNQVSGAIPSSHGSYYLLPASGKSSAVSIHIAGDIRPLITVDNVLAPRDRIVRDRNPAVIGMFRHCFIPDANLVVTLPWTNDQLVVRKINLDEALDKSGIDYLFVTSRPTSEATRGESYRYAVAVKSKRGEIEYQLASGPPGMTISKAGVVSWEIPKDLANDKVDVILSVRDASGQEVFQSYRIALAGEKLVSQAARQPVIASEAKPAPGGAEAQRIGGEVPENDAPAEVKIRLPRIEPIRFEGTQAKVKLPGTVDAVAAAGGGRFLILHLKRLRQLAVFDVSLGKVIKYLPVASDDVAMTAGSDRIVVALRDKKILQRWNLRTLERELAVPNPNSGTVQAIGMGSASEGPVAVSLRNSSTSGSQLLFLDGTSLQPLDLTPSSQYGNQIRYSSTGESFRVSANGRIFIGGNDTFVVDGNSVVQKSNRSSRIHSALPNADGTILYSSSGLFNSDLKQIGVERPVGIPFPAMQPGYYLTISTGDLDLNPQAAKADRLSIHVEGDRRPLVSLEVPIRLSLVDRLSLAGQRLPIEQRFWFVPDAQALVQLPTSNDYLLVHKVDIDTLLEKADIDFLFVNSRPPYNASLGKKFEYQMIVKSKRGGVKYQLSSGPQGIQVSSSGLVTWSVPEDHISSREQVIVGVQDASSQEVFHSFAIHLPEAARREAANLAAAEARRQAEMRAQQEAALAAQNKARMQAALAQAKAALLNADQAAKSLLSRTQQVRTSKPPLAPNRTWTDAEGNQIEASLQEVFAGMANFKRQDGQMMLAPIERLSKEDQNTVNELAATAVAERRQREAELTGSGVQVRAPLTIIGMGLKNSLNSTRSFLPAYNAGSDGEPMLSWRVHLLPYVGGRDLHRLFRLDQPWDSEHNKQLIPFMPQVYRAYQSGAGEGKTNFLGICGANCIFEGATGTRPIQVTDGLTNTAAIVEASDEKAVIWTKPDDWEFSGAASVRGIAGLRDGGFFAVMADGTVKFISSENGSDTIRQLFLRNDGQRANLK